MGIEPLRVSYRLTETGVAATRRAEALALEQSVEMPIEAVSDERVLREVVARVEGVDAQADGTSLARLALSAESIGGDAGQLMNMLFGNSSLLDDVRVQHVELSAALASRFGGPQQGIEGIRRLTGVYGRALGCTALKPIGSSIEALARLTRVFCEAGLDVIKDDHGWAADAHASFKDRVVACQRQVDAAGRGRSTRTLYAPAVSGSLDAMRDQIRFAQGTRSEHGSRGADGRGRVQFPRPAARVSGAGISCASGARRQSVRACGARSVRCSGCSARMR